MGSNLLPLLILTAGVTANVDKIKNLVGYSKNIAVQAELHEMTKMMMLDAISGAELPKPDQFADYLKANMRPQKTKSGNTRDLSTDQWGTAYKYEHDEKANTVRVTSAGADFKFGTSDDLYSERHLN